MLKSDVPQLVAYIGELWPHYRQPIGAEQYDIRVMAWMDVLGDLDASAVRAAIASLAEREFAPTPGQVRAAANSMVGSSFPAWDEFWSWVRAEASRASLFTLDDGPRFECPWPDLAGLVTLDDLMDGDVVVDDADLTNVRQGHLRRRYDSRAARAHRDVYGQVPALTAYLNLSADRALGPVS